jgi:hypothetical protein
VSASGSTSSPLGAAVGEISAGSGAVPPRVMSIASALKNRTVVKIDFSISELYDGVKAILHFRFYFLSGGDSLVEFRLPNMVSDNIKKTV